MIKYIVLFFTSILVPNFIVLAHDTEKCISECSGSYHVETEDCQSDYGNDPDYYDDLQYCIEYAQSNYESCKDECETTKLD